MVSAVVRMLFYDGSLDDEGEIRVCSLRRSDRAREIYVELVAEGTSPVAVGVEPAPPFLCCRNNLHLFHAPSYTPVGRRRRIALKGMSRKRSTPL